MNYDSKLADKVVMVTGGASGIGKSLVQTFSKQESKVVLADVDGERATAVAKKIREGEILAVKADITSKSDVSSLINQTIEKYDQLDVLINNAGIVDREYRNVAELPPEVWKEIIEVNLTGTFLVTQAALPYLIESKGNVVIITSALGQKGGPTFFRSIGSSAYVATKFGLEGFMESLSLEMQDYEVNVNALYPDGKVNTGFFEGASEEETENLLNPEIMNDPSLYLASLEPGELTGASFSARQWEQRVI